MEFQHSTLRGNNSKLLSVTFLAKIQTLRSQKLFGGAIPEFF